MGQLLESWPSAALTLFARFGVGSRDKAGFRPEQSLREVLARHLIFDPETVLLRLEEAESQQRRWRISAESFAKSAGLRVDCRSQSEFERFSLPGAHLLNAELARRVGARPDEFALCFFDHDGTMAGSAALHFERLGCSRLAVLDGGLTRWAEQVDPDFPLYGSGRRLRPGGPPLLQADPRQIRFALNDDVGLGLQAGDPGLVPFPCLRLWRRRDYLAVLRPSEDDTLELCRRIRAWLPASPAHPWRHRPEDPVQQQLLLEQALRTEVAPNLASHKGSIELVSFSAGVARVRLGGGCQGCSSAAITVGQEVSAALLRALPELDTVEDASEHESPQASPHH